MAMFSENMDSNTGFAAMESMLHPRLVALFAILKTLEPGKRDVLFKPKLLKVGIAWDQFQHLAMILNPHIGWKKDFISKSCYFTLLSSFWDPSQQSISDPASYAGFWVSVFIIMVSVLLVRASFNERIRRISKCVTHAVVSPLLFPFLNIFLSRMICNENDELWLFPETKCWGGTHISTLIGGVIAIFLLCAGALCVLTTIYDASPFSLHPLRRANSSVDTLALTYKISMSLCFHLLLAKRMVQEYCFIVMAMTLIYIAFLSLSLPYYDITTTKIKVCVLGIVWWGSLIGYLTAKDEGKQGLAANDTATITFMCGIPVIIVLSLYVTMLRVSRDCLAEIKRLVSSDWSPRQYGVFPRMLPGNEQLFSQFDDLEGWLLEIEEGEDYNDTCTEQANQEEHDILLPYIDVVYFYTDVELSTRYLILWDNTVGVRPTSKMLALASRIYTKGMVKFRHYREVHVQFAAFLIRYLERSHIAINFLSCLEGNVPESISIASKYKVFEMSNRLKAGLGIRDKSHTTTLSKARKNHKEALELMYQFWQRLSSSKKVNLVGLALLANQIADKREKAGDGFKLVLSQHSADIQVLSQFSNFLLQVMLDKDAYDRCREQIEFLSETKRHKNRRGGNASEGCTTVDTTGAAVHTPIINEVMSPSIDNAGSRTVQLLQLTIRVAFIPLILLLIGNFLVAYLYVKQQLDLIDQVYIAGQARTLFQRSGVTLQQFIKHIETEETSQQTVTDATGLMHSSKKQKLVATKSLLEAAHNSLTFGSAAFTYPPQTLFLQTPSVSLGYYSTSTDYNRGTISFWSLGNLIIASFDILLDQALASVPNHKYSKFLIENLAGPVSHACNISISFTEDESDQILSTSETVAVILFITSVLVIFVVYLMFVWNFNKIAASKMSTLSLFTLIPSITLSSTSEEAHQKLITFDKENDEDMRGMDGILGKLGPAPLEAQPESKRTDDIQLQDDEPRKATAEMQMAMTDQQALESLNERRTSVVAIILKQGLQSGVLSQHKSNENSTSANYLSPRKEAVDPSETISVSEAPETEENPEQIERREKTAREVNNEDEEYRAATPEQPVTITNIVLFMLALTAFSVAVTALTFKIQSVVTSLEEPYERKRESHKRALVFKQSFHSIVSSARLFSQWGDDTHFDAYQENINGGALLNIPEKLWTHGMLEKEITLINEAIEISDTINHRCKMAMKLTRQYYRQDEAELSTFEWDEEFLTKEKLSTYRKILIPQRRSRSSIADTGLPNENAREYSRDLVQQFVRSGLLLKNSLDELLHVSNSTNLSDLLDEWSRNGKILLKQDGRLSEPLFESSNRDLGTIVDLTNKKSAMRIEALDAIPEIIFATDAYVQNAYDARFAETEPDIGLDYSNEKTEWDAAVYQPYLTLQIQIQCGLRVIRSIDADREKLFILITRWAKNHELLIKDVETFPGADEDFKNMLTQAMMCSEVTTHSNIEQANARLSSLGGVYMNVWSSLFDTLVTRKVLSEVFTAKHSLARSCVFDDYFRLLVQSFDEKISEFEKASSSRLLADAQSQYDEAHNLLSIALILFSCCTVLSVMGCSAALRIGVNIIKRVLTLSLVFLPVTCMVITALINTEIKNVTVKYNKMFTTDDSLASILKVIDGIHITGFSYVQFSDGYPQMQYWDILNSHDLQNTEDKLVGIDVLRDPHGHLEQSLREKLELARSSFDEARWLERISFRLLYQPAQEGGPPLYPAPKIILNQKWNLTNEDGFSTDSVLYADDYTHPLMYSNRDADLLKLPSERAAMARYVFSSRRYLSLALQSRDYVYIISDIIHNTWEDYYDSSKAISHCKAVPILSCIIIGCGLLLLLVTVIEALSRSGTGEQEVKMELNRLLFSDMTKRCRIALSFVVVLSTLLFVVLFTGLETDRDDIRILNLASSTQWMASKSLVIANKISKAGYDRPSLQQLLIENARELRRVRSDLYSYTYSHSDTTQEERLFGAMTTTSPYVFFVL